MENLKRSTFLFAAPSTAPSDARIRAINSTTIAVQWRKPHQKDLNGDLKGYKVMVEVTPASSSGPGGEDETSQRMNFTLDPSVHSLLLGNVSSLDTYTARIGAYNRQGMGPFTRDLTFKMPFISSQGN